LGKENAQLAARINPHHPECHEEKPEQYQFDKQSNLHLHQVPVECDYHD